MGMFDYIHCDAPLPETPVPPPRSAPFQTKDTPSQGLALYTITANGRLTQDTRSAGTGEQAPESVTFDGDLCFYTSNHPDVGWWEYRARFWKGVLLGISVEAFDPPEGRNLTEEAIAALRARE